MEQKNEKEYEGLDQFEKKVLHDIGYLKSAVNNLTALNKDVLDFNEGCFFTSLSKSQMYKLTMQRKIPFFRPEGKKIYFEKARLIEWLLRNPQY